MLRMTFPMSFSAAREAPPFHDPPKHPLVVRNSGLAKTIEAML